MATGFEVIGEDTAYSSTRFAVARVRVRTPDASEVTREVVRHPGAVSVVAVQSDGQTAVMVRQFRAAVGKCLLEIPAGTRDVPGEEPLETARRELIEEVGLTATSFTKLTEFYNSPGSSDQHHVIYLAEGLQDVPNSSQTVEEQHMTVEYVRLNDASQLVTSGVVVDAKSIIGLFMARDFMADRR